MIGQIWIDLDKRMKGRRLRIVRMWNPPMEPMNQYAVCVCVAMNGEQVSRRETKIRVRRLARPNFALAGSAK